MYQSQIDKLAKSLNAEIKETHISWVLLTKRFAYKIKKPVKTTFLDFSSLKKRESFCREEIKINSILAPDVYLDVVPLVEGEKEILIEEKGKTIDYAVKMKRLDLSKQMDQMLKKNLLKEFHVQEIAKAISKFHSKAEVIGKGWEFEQLPEEFNNILSFSDAITKYIGRREAEKVERIAGTINKFLFKYEEFFLERCEKGFVRNCHGDLHSANIFLYKKPVIFDRIEFNERFRHIDILDELAFFCMDLESYGKKILSGKFLKYYIQASDLNYEKREMKVFNYYKCYRANVRAKVNLLRAAQEEDKTQLKKDINAAKKYLELMYEYGRIL
jgi:uncharacterized protein